MADEAKKEVKAPAPRKRPAAKKAATNNGKGPATYNVFKDTGKGLEAVVMGYSGKTPDSVVQALVGENDSLVGAKLVVVPVRNFKVFSTEVETKRRVKVSAG